MLTTQPEVDASALLLRLPLDNCRPLTGADADQLLLRLTSHSPKSRLTQARDGLPRLSVSDWVALRY